MASNIILGISNLFVACLVILISLPLVKGKVSMNRLYGIRFKRSYESEENWYKINAYGGRQLIIWSIPIAVTGILSFFLPDQGNEMIEILLACAPLLLLVTALISYQYARKL